MKRLGYIEDTPCEFVICDCGQINSINNTDCCNCGLNVDKYVDKLDENQDARHDENIAVIDFVDDSIEFYLSEYPEYNDDDVRQIEITV